MDASAMTPEPTTVAPPADSSRQQWTLTIAAPTPPSPTPTGPTATATTTPSASPPKKSSKTNRTGKAGGTTTPAGPNPYHPTDQRLTFTVRGIPIGQGRITTYGRGMSVHSNAKTLKPWRNAVAFAAEAATEAALGPHPYPLDGPVGLYVCFTVPKPKNAPKRRRSYPITRPDLSHLLRAVEDALTAAGVWRDDSQLVDERAVKAYPGEHQHALTVPGALIRVYPIGGEA